MGGDKTMVSKKASAKELYKVREQRGKNKCFVRTILIVTFHYNNVIGNIYKTVRQQLYFLTTILYLTSPLQSKSLPSQSLSKIATLEIYMRRGGGAMKWRTGRGVLSY